jgi:fibronectin type 3 domain-containing protein
MIHRPTLRRLRVKLAAGAALVTVAAVLALVIPGLATALVVPTIDSPGQGDVMGASRTITFSAANDASEYDLYAGLPSGGTCDTVPAPELDTGMHVADDSHPFHDSTALDGPWCYWVAANDGAGGLDFSDPVEITADSSPPTLPTDLALTTGSSPRNTAASITFTASSDPHGPITYQLVRGGSTNVGSPTTSTTIADSPMPSQGTHTYTVIATDGLGNSSAPSAGFDVVFDTTAPSPPTGFTLTGSTPRKEDPEFTFGASSDPSGPVTYQLTRGGSPVGTPSASTDLTDSPGDGQFTYRVVAIDAAGNVSSPSGSIPVRIDNATAAPGSFALQGSTPRQADPVFTFHASSDLSTPVTYQLWRDGVAKGTPSQSLTLTDSPGDGHFVYTVVATDSLGNVSPPSNAIAVDIDNSGPSAPTSFTLNGSTPRKTDPSFTFVDSSDPSAVSYQLYRDGSPRGATTTGNTFTDASPGDGSYSYSVAAVDALGNPGTPTSPIVVRVDNTGPPAPTAVALVGLSPRNTLPAVSFTASTDLSAPVSYQLYRNSVAVGTPQPSTTLTDPTLPSDGTYTYTVKAIDALGNAGGSVSSPAVSVVIDTLAPTAPTNFQLVGAASTPDPPHFKFTASTDAHGPIQYSLLRAGADAGTVTSTCGSFLCMTDSTIVADGTDDGTYAYTVKATDFAGNHSTTAGSVTVTIDGGAPSVPGGVRTTTPLTRFAPVISWNASTGEPASYRVFRNGDSIGTVNAPATTFSDGTLVRDSSHDGTYTYTVAATDAAGNQSAASLPVQIMLDSTLPLSAAALTIAQSPTAAKPVLIWPASGSNDLAGYNVYRGGARVNGSLVTTTSFTDAGLDADGTYVYTVRAVDKAGNESPDSIGASVLYDTTPPGAPGASAVAAPSGGTSTVNWTPASDAGSGIAAYQVRRSTANGAAPASLAEGTPVCGSIPPSALGCADSGLTQGAGFRYSVFAIDAVGNVSPAGPSATITVPSTTDKTPPKAPTALHAVVANGLINLTWKNPKSDLATVSVVWNSKRAPRSTTDGNPIYHGTGAKVSVKVPKLSAGKLVRFAVFAVDKAGNVSVAARATINVPRPSSVSLAPNGRLSGNPNLTWNAVTGATYYNVQVFEGTQASKRVSISWPAVTKYTLPGKAMKKGKTYTWYVWPGIGAKASAKYGKLIGKVTFVYGG